MLPRLYVRHRLKGKNLHPMSHLTFLSFPFLCILALGHISDSLTYPPILFFLFQLNPTLAFLASLIIAPLIIFIGIYIFLLCLLLSCRFLFLPFG